MKVFEPWKAQCIEKVYIYPTQLNTETDGYRPKCEKTPPQEKTTLMKDKATWRIRDLPPPTDPC